jgi:acetate CoA/acetoacetate CoA-transferase alpha subunit
MQEGKQILEVDGKAYILELPLRADVALIHAWKADKMGNVIYHRTARNFNQIMASAADYVIVEAEEIVEIGELDPDIIVTPGCLVDMVVQARLEDRDE